MTRDELAGILRAGVRSIILEADDWRPLADHVLELGRRGFLTGEVCAECGGEGVVYWTETGSEHAPDCDPNAGGCSSSCPIPVPIPASDSCPSCGGSGRDPGHSVTPPEGVGSTHD